MLNLCSSYVGGFVLQSSLAFMLGAKIQVFHAFLVEFNAMFSKLKRFGFGTPEFNRTVMQLVRRVMEEKEMRRMCGGCSLLFCFLIFKKKIRTRFQVSSCENTCSFFLVLGYYKLLNFKFFSPGM